MKKSKERRLILRGLKEGGRKRFEVVLISLVQEAFINGVSTRKIERLARALGKDGDLSFSGIGDDEGVGGKGEGVSVKAIV